MTTLPLTGQTPRTCSKIQCLNFCFSFLGKPASADASAKANGTAPNGSATAAETSETKKKTEEESKENIHDSQNSSSSKASAFGGFVFGNAKPKDSVAAKPFGGFVFGQKTTAAVGVGDVATGEENVTTAAAATPDVKANGGTPTAVELDQATYVELPVFGQKTVTTEVLDKPVEEDLMAKFKPAQGNWSCDVCMVSNPGDKSKCLACETPKPVAASSTEAQKDDLMAKFKPSAGNWSCDVCMVSNPGDKTKCLACETPKPGGAAKTDDLMAKFKPSAGNWSCDVCMVSNPGDKTACLACETPKSGSAAAAIKTAPKPFAIGANGGFKFDAKPAADTSAAGDLGGFKFVNTAATTVSTGGFKFEPSASGSNNTTVSSGFRCDVKTTESIAAGGFKFESKPSDSSEPNAGGFKFEGKPSNSSEPSAGGFKFDTTKPKDSSTDKEGEGGFKFGGTNDAVKNSPADAAGGFAFGTKTSASSAETIGGEGTGSTTGFFFKANGSSPPTGAASGFTFSTKAGDTSPSGPAAKGFQFSTFGSSTPGKTTEGASIFGPAARSGGATGFSFFNTPTSTRVRSEGGGSITAGSPGFQFSTPPEKPQVGPSNQCWGSVFWCGSAPLTRVADPHSFHPDPDPAF
jgi:hypothetical protein